MNLFGFEDALGVFFFISSLGKRVCVSVEGVLEYSLGVMAMLDKPLRWGFAVKGADS